MASVKIRSCSLFLGGKKVGQVHGVDYTYTTGDEAQFGDPGYLGHSDGAGTTSLTADAIVPVAGMDVDIVTQMQNRVDFDVGLGIVNGKIHRASMRCIKSNFKGDQKAGTLMGSFEFQGGEPSITG